MELQQAYIELQDLYDEYRKSEFLELKAKPQYKRKYHSKVKDVENKVWQLFQSCPELNDFVPYPGEFFSNNFSSDFERIMEKLNERMTQEK